MQTPLLRLSPFLEDSLTLSDVFEGVAIFGRSGSGKSSGSGAHMARSFLRQGFGGLVLCAKEDEADNWEAYAAQTGRSGDIIRIDGTGRYRFNPLEYEMQRVGIPQDVLAKNLVSTLQTVIEVATRASGLAAGSKGDVFWDKSSRKYLTNAVELLYAETGRVRISELLDLIDTAAKSKKELQSKKWQKSSFFYKIFNDFLKSKGGSAHKLPDEDASQIAKFWLNNFPLTPEKTRGNVIATISADVDPLLRGTFRKLFSTDTNVIPEMSHDGKIILLDFPTLVWNESGVLAQMIFKYVWMRATQRRKITRDTRPVFLFADECQLFMSSYFSEFQSTARAYRCATVLLTQNLPMFYSRVGGDMPEHTIDGLMGNLKTKIFHQQNDQKTNEWASKLIGKSTFWRQSINMNEGWSEGENIGYSEGENTGWNQGLSKGDSDGYNVSAGRSSSASIDSHGGHSSSISYNSGIASNVGTTETFTEGRSGGLSVTRSSGKNRGNSGGRSYGMTEERDYAVEPHEFATGLLSGGPANGNCVTGVVVSPGQPFARNGKHWMQVAFPQ